ncbi:MAG: zinc ribbon domain-containing protein [Candidatus Diapherotrites archaeon]|nr:zinc ribbon domain-containing protein [Candidatus Diapherotrites archaeon]
MKSQNDFFFCTVNGPPKPLSQNALGIILKRLAVKAGLGKWKKVKSSNGIWYSHYQGQRIYFTKFRRSAATWALKNLKSHALAGKRIWGNEASSMIKIYSGLVSEDANEAYREALGLAQPTQVENILKPKTCFKCHTMLSPTQSLCPNCKIETDTSKLIDTQLLKEAEMTALREEMKMLQTALAQITLKMQS